MASAADRFREAFRIAHMDPLRASDMSRTRGTGSPPLSTPLASPPQPGASREASMHPAEHQRLSGPEAAQYLGISASTLSKLRVFGGGPKFHKLGRRVVYDTRDLDGWFSAR